jgi:hypothetical protein
VVAFMPSECAWYKTVLEDDDLEQGDFLCKCPVLVPLNTLRAPPEKSGRSPPKAIPEIDSSVRVYNVVVLTQSCDIPKTSTKYILVCPYKRLAVLQKDGDYFRDNDNLENLRRGYIRRLHLLNKCLLSNVNIEDHKTDDYIVLNFSQVFSIPKGYALNHARACGDRLRLKSPYKERMSQAFAKYFMRIDIEDGEEITPFIVRIEDD